jgi:hypothetical protein
MLLADTSRPESFICIVTSLILKFDEENAPVRIRLKDSHTIDLSVVIIKVGVLYLEPRKLHVGVGGMETFKFDTKVHQAVVWARRDMRDVGQTICCSYGILLR